MTVAELQALVLKLQSTIEQLELTNKGAVKSLEFRLEAILQANLDTFWLLICAILVFLMQAGFLCLESGLSRAKSSINVALKNVADFGIAVATFWAFGFALMYGASINGLVGSKFFFFTTKVAGYQSFFVFQAMFVATAATIVSGAVAERLKFFSYVVITFVTSGIIYPIVGHWVWAINFSNPNIKFGWLGKLGFIDFAGSSVVHSVGGWVALAILLIIGNRTGRFREGKKTFQGSNTPLAALGAIILWFGWFGFNGFSQLAMGTFDDVNAISKIAVNTHLAGASGVVVGAIISRLHGGKTDIIMMLNGALAGLVAITAEPLTPTPILAIVIGGFGSIIMYYGTKYLERLHLDDVVGAIPVHMFAGIFGTLVVPISNPDTSFGTQLIGVISVVLFSFVLSLITFKVLKQTIGLRISKEAEKLGTDKAEIGVVAYSIRD